MRQHNVVVCGALGVIVVVFSSSSSRKWGSSGFVYVLAKWVAVLCVREENAGGTFLVASVRGESVSPQMIHAVKAVASFDGLQDNVRGRSSVSFNQAWLLSIPYIYRSSIATKK